MCSSRFLSESVQGTLGVGGQKVQRILGGGRRVGILNLVMFNLKYLFMLFECSAALALNVL